MEDADFLFTTCESLIASDGSILISSNQIAEKKLIELHQNEKKIVISGFLFKVVDVLVLNIIFLLTVKLKEMT